MQDKAIVNIGKLQLKKSHFDQPHQQYIQNMHPGKEYNILLTQLATYTKELSGK